MAASSPLVLWPLMLVVLTALLVVWLIWRRRSSWRREFFSDLDRIEAAAKTLGDSEAWARLAVLLKRLALQRRTRRDVAGLSGEPWLRQLDELVGADLFTNGPGRGLIIFPYLGDRLDDDMSRRRQADLKATLKGLRNHSPRRGAAGAAGAAR